MRHSDSASDRKKNTCKLEPKSTQNVLCPFGFFATIAHVTESSMSLCWPIHRRHIGVVISILLVAFALAPVPFIGQNRSSEVVLPTSRPCDRSAQQRLALVIGNGAYSIKPLRNPPNDATAVSNELRELGFSVTSGLNKSQSEMEQMIREFGDRLRSTCGVGLFYYAGHGVQIAGRNYLIPVNADIQNEADYKYKSIDLNWALDQMYNEQNPLNIVILDACRSDPFPRSHRSDQGGLAQVSAPTGTLIAYATAPDSTASDGDGANSPYTQELIKQMHVPGVLVETMLRHVAEQVSARTGGKQEPWFNANIKGDFYFNNGTGPTATTKKDTNPRPSVAPPIDVPEAPRSKPDEDSAVARAREELRGRGIAVDVTSVKNALMSIDLDVLKLLTTAKIQPSVIEEAFRQVSSDGVTVARKFFDNSSKSPEAIKWFDSALGNGVDPNFTVPNDYYEREGVLIEAIRAANVPAIKVLLEHGASPHPYQNLFLTRYPLTRFLYPLRLIVDDDRLTLEEKQDLTKAFIKAGVVIPKVFDPGQSGWPSVMYEAKNLRDQDAPKLSINFSPSQPFCSQPENSVCKHAGSDWCSAIAKMPNKLVFDFKKNSSSPLYDVTLLHLLSIQGNKAYFLGLTKYITYDYVLVEVAKDASSWTVLRYMAPESGMGLCKKDSDGSQPEYCWRRIPIHRVAGSDEMRFDDFGLSWRMSREECSSLYPR
ncbi:MAG TPA: caspase family protein [Pyrinomonadaceae bacterium]|nr:caspase family protein [Pyrinomonadaceae bacterium]